MEPVKTLNTYIASIAVNLSAFAVGTCLGWTSPVIPKLKSDDISQSPLDHKITAENEAWISSIIALGALLPPFISGPLADRFGRKWILLSGSLIFILSYALLLIATEVWVIYLARAIQGAGGGYTTTVLPMYIGEIASDQVRGSTGSLLQLFVVIGNLYVFCIGPYVSYQALQWYCMAIPILFAVVFFFMPESPYYYVSKGRYADAVKSLQFLRGQSAEAVRVELLEIQANIEEANTNKGTIMDICRNYAYRKALIITLGLIIFQQFSGITAVVFNAQSIFENANTGFDAAVSGIIIGAMQVASSGLTPFIADRWGRKLILLISAVLMSIGLAAVGAFFYIQATGGNIDNILWLPLTVLILYIIVYCFSFGPIPYAILGEMFPTNIKSIATSINITCCWLIVFVVNIIYPHLNELGTYYAFWMFAAFCAGAFFFVLFVVIETKGLSLQEIQHKLQRQNVQTQQLIN